MELRWFGHISYLWLSNAGLLGTVQGKDLLAQLGQLNSDRTRWKGVVVKSSVVHEQPLKVMGYTRLDYM